MKNVIKDLSTLTTIPYSTLQSLFNKINSIIAYDVKESLLDKENICELDIGIGRLLILVDEEEVKYKFIPNNSLIENVNESIINKSPNLVAEVEESLCKKILHTYKDLI